jgi:prevent-host-death family protein
MTMLMVNIAEAKAKLSEYLEAVARGEQVIICNRNQPVAELRAIAPQQTKPRDLSPLFPGRTFMTDAFFEPMSEAELEEWYGPGVFPAEVAKRPPVYGEKKSTRKRKKRS